MISVLSVSSTAYAKSPDRIYGRYEITINKAEELCNAVGRQVSKYSPIPPPPSYRLAKTLQDRAPEIDFRCDAPIEDDDLHIEVVKWRPIDLVEQGTESGLAGILYAQRIGRAERPWSDGKLNDDRLNVIREIQSSFLVVLKATGIARFERADVKFGSLGTRAAYRLNLPMSFRGDALQQCWMVFFDPNGDLSKLKNTEYPINEVFYYGGNAYVSLIWGHGIYVLSLEKIARNEEDVLGWHSTTNQAECAFQLTGK